MPAGYLEHSPADVVGRLLVQLGVGSDPDIPGLTWPIFDGIEPDVPDNLITVYDTKGFQFGRNELGIVSEAPTITFRVRSTIPGNGFRKTSEIQKTISEFPPFTQVFVTDPVLGVRTYEVHTIKPSTTIINLGKNAPSILGATASTSKRNIYVLNAVVVLRQIS